MSSLQVSSIAELPLAFPSIFVEEAGVALVIDTLRLLLGFTVLMPSPSSHSSAGTLA